VQLPPSGQPVVLLCEAQVTGGYPRIGSVLSCDLWKLSQLGGGESVSWVLVNEQQAQRLQARHELDRKRYQQAIEYNKATTHVD
jgi:allophanate hydrolase subunit 2